MRRRSIALTAGVSIGLLGAGASLSTATATAAANTPHASMCCCSRWTGCTSRISPASRRAPHVPRLPPRRPRAPSTPMQSHLPVGLIPAWSPRSPAEPAHDERLLRRLVQTPLLPAGTPNCATAKRGTEVPWDEAIDRSQNFDREPRRRPELDRRRPGSRASKHTLGQTLASPAAILRPSRHHDGDRPSRCSTRPRLPVDPRTARRSTRTST